MGFGMKLQKKSLGWIAASHGFWENCLSILCINCSHAFFARLVKFSIFVIILLAVASASYAQILGRCNLANIDTRLLAVTPASSGQRFTLTPFLSVGERFDDNIFQTFSNRENDFITVVSPGICADYVSTAPTPDTDLYLKYQANIESFAKHSSQNQVSHQGSLNFSSQLTPALSLRVADTLVITDESSERAGVANQFASLRPASQQGRRRTSTNIATGALDVQLGTRSTLGLVFNSILNNVDVPTEVDETSYSVGVNLGYFTNVAQRSMGYLSYLVTFHTFQPNASVTPGNKTADFQVQNVQVGFRHELTPTLSGNIAIGPSFVTSKDPKLDGDTGVAVNLEVIKTLGIGRASLNYTRNFTSGGGGGGAVTRDILRLLFFAEITGKLTAAVDSSLAYYNFQNISASNIVTNGGNRLAWAIRPSLSYQILRPWRLSASYAYELTDFTQRVSNVNLATIGDHRFAFTSQFALRQWLLLDLSYRYSTRQLNNGIPLVGIEPFYRNEVILRLTAAPSFLF
jgi:Putative beta-barrel porin 2